MKTRFLIAALMAGAMTLPVAAESPEEKGLAIAMEMLEPLSHDIDASAWRGPTMGV